MSKRRVTAEDLRAIDAILDEHETLDAATVRRLSDIVTKGLPQTPKKTSRGSTKP